MKKGYLAKMILLFTFILGCFGAIGISSWVIINTKSNTHTGHDFGSDKVNVTVRYIAYTGFKQTYVEGSKEYLNSSGATSDESFVDLADSSAGDSSTNLTSLNSLLAKYCDLNYDYLKEQAKNSSDKKAILEDGEHTGEGKGDSSLADGEKYLVYLETKNVVIEYSTKTESGTCGSTTTKDQYQIISGSYRLWREKYKVSYRTIQSAVNDFDTITVSKGSKIPVDVIKDSIRIDSTNKYKLAGFYKSDSNGNVTVNAFNIYDPVEKDESICAVFNMETDELKKSNLTDAINNNTGSINVFDSSSANFDVSSDYSYFEPLKTISLGEKGTDTTIKSGSTVKFCLNSGDEFKEIADNNDNVVEPEFYSNNLQYKICLQSDLIVNGALTLGGAYGNNWNNFDQGMINKDYVCLDLNGHNVYVNKGGSFKSYGLIKDSMNKGSIYVKGGYFSSLAVFRDYKGGGATNTLNSNGIMPFALYSIPYVRCKMYVTQDSDGTIGTFECLLRIKGAGMDAARTTITLRFIGNSSKYFLNLKSKKDSEKEMSVCIDTHLLGGISEYENSQNKKTDEYKKCILYRNEWIVENAVFSIEALELKIKLSFIETTLTTDKYDFPISPFFDLRINNSDMSFKQPVHMYPGSSLILNENSNLCFEYNSDRAAQLFVTGDYLMTKDEKRVDSLELRNSVTMSSSGVVYNVVKPLAESATFWKYYGRPQVYNFGTTWFKAGNSSSKFYKIAGEFNCNRFGIYSSSISDGKTYSLHSNEKTLDLVCDNSGIGKVYLKTYGYEDLSGFADSTSNMQQLKGYALPLISNGKAYFKDNTSSNTYFNQKQGTYDIYSGIIRMENDDSAYFLKIRDSFDLSNKEVSIVSGSYDATTKIMSTNDKKYVFFSECFYPFDETNKTIDIVSINKSSSSITLSFDDAYKMWLRPKT